VVLFLVLTLTWPIVKAWLLLLPLIAMLELNKICMLMALWIEVALRLALSPLAVYLLLSSRMVVSLSTSVTSVLSLFLDSLTLSQCRP
jgi:hypothetical protein